MTGAGPPSRVRVVAAPVALAGLIAAVVAVQLALLGGFGAEEEVSRRDGRRWAEASVPPARGRPALLWSVQELELPGTGRVTSIAAAETAADGPAPLGADAVPDAGDVLVSPALQRRLDDVPDGLVDGRRVVGVLGDEVLARPDDLVLLTGWDPDELARADPTVLRVGRFVADQRDLEEDLEIDLFPDTGRLLSRMALLPVTAAPLALATVLLLRRLREPEVAAIVSVGAGVVVGTALVLAGAGLVVGGTGSPWFARDLRPSVAAVALVGLVTALIAVGSAAVARRASPTDRAVPVAAAIVLAVTIPATAALVDGADDDDGSTASRGRAAYAADVVLSGSEDEGSGTEGRPAILLDALRFTPGVETVVPVHRAAATVAGLGRSGLFDGTEVAVASCADVTAVLRAEAAGCLDGPMLAGQSARLLEAFPAYREPAFTLDFGARAGEPVRVRTVGSWRALDRPSWEGLVPPEALPSRTLDGLGPDEVALRTDGRLGTVAAVAATARRVAPGVDARVRGELAAGATEDPWSTLAPLAALPALLVLVGALVALALALTDRGRWPPSTTPS